MCYILISKQLRQPSPSVEEQIRGILKDQAGKNNDGFFIKNGVEEIRTLDDKQATPLLRDVALNNLMVHFRWASAGKIKEENVHGWELGEWKFFHNGGVSDYVKTSVSCSARDQEDTDSYLFFQDLYMFLQEVNGRKDKQVERVIREVASQTNFYGRAILYNTQTDKMYLFGDFHVYCFGDSYIVISSASLSLNKKMERKIHGFEFDYTNESVVGELTTTGIGVIHNFSRPGFVYRYLGVLKDYKVTPTVHSHVHSQYTQTQQELNEGTDDDYPQWDAGNWRYENGNYYRKPVPELPVPKPPTSEYSEMVDNISKASQELLDDDLEIDPEILSDSNGVVPVTSEQVDHAITQMLQNEFGYIGYDTQTGFELYMDDTGIHDQHQDCCRIGTCRKVNEYDGIEFLNLENLPLHQAA